MGKEVHLVVWQAVLADLRVGGVAGAIHRIWLLRRHSYEGWLRFADEAVEHNLTWHQFCLLASLWEISKEPTIEAMSKRLAYLPDWLCDSFFR